MHVDDYREASRNEEKREDALRARKHRRDNLLPPEPSAAANPWSRSIGEQPNEN